MKNDITLLPDYPAIKKFAAALWMEDNSYNGAAVMVGAGFSRVAASSGDAKSRLPLWNDLSEELTKELGARNSADPLRLAEEYRAYFGQQALLDLLKNSVNDAAWIPGALHKDLLELPWTEVLTTNWDSLLERASMTIHDPVYNIVNRQEDLSNSRSPRIVKLHGTINITDKLTFTQEDYRKYPQHHAAFVNFARQVFIENELCLIGFSGDDPNFLQWAGWVRDHLATHARRIYLVGALNLTAAKRKYLESINVAPIDLSDLVAEYDDVDTKHKEATKIFTEVLRNLKPRKAWEWKPTELRPTLMTGEESDKRTQDSAYAAKLLEEQLPILEKNRLAYPGWLVCPSHLRWKIKHQLRHPWPTQNNLSAMPPDARSKILYEIAWRYDVTYDVIPLWLANELLTICDPAKPNALSKKQQMEIALLLLKNTRWLDEQEAQSIKKATTTILEINAGYWQESSNELAYHCAIIARDQFDFNGIEKAVENVVAEDAVWKLRKASLLGELGRFEEGETLIAEAYRELLAQKRNNRNSIYVLSRLAWAHWLKRGINQWKDGNELEVFPSSYNDPKCNPWDHLDHIRNRATDALEKQRRNQGIMPLFEPGSYKDNSSTISINNELHPLLLMDGISVTTGVPLRWNTINFLCDSAKKLTALHSITGEHLFTLAIRSANSESDDVLNKVFSRTQIACFMQEDVENLIARCERAIEFWSARLNGVNANTKSLAVQHLRVFIEVLARVSVRTIPEQAKKLFLLAVKLGKVNEFQHFWLFGSLKHLIEYSLGSIPESQQHELLSEALSFALSSEIEIVGSNNDWPNPVIQLPGIRNPNEAIDRRIGEIIDQISPCSSSCASALLRLIPLCESGFLKDEERKKLGEAIWGVEADYASLPQTGLFSHALLELPAPNSDEARKAVRQYLFSTEEEGSLNAERIRDMAFAAQQKGINVLPLTEQAMNDFGKLTSWRPKKGHSDIFGFANQQEQQMAGYIGKALAYSVVPALSDEALSEENFGLLLSFYNEVKAPETIIAFSRFAAARDIFSGQVEKMIRRGFYKNDANVVAYSSFALLQWRELESSLATDRLISRLIDMIGFKTNGLPAMLWTVRQMLSKGYISEEGVESLAENVPIIFDSSGYNAYSSIGQEKVDISLVRKACVKLVKDMMTNNQTKTDDFQRILGEAKEDALPEVRFAEDEDD